MVNYSLDCCGHLCPVPILMTEEKMNELGAGAVLEVIFTDPGAKPDLNAWCRANDHEWVGFKEAGRKGFAYIRKGHDPTTCLQRSRSDRPHSRPNKWWGDPTTEVVG